MEHMKTAVDFFQEQIINIVEGKCDLSEVEIFEQAKQMEKEQIIDSFNNGYDAGWAMSNEYCIIEEDEEEMIYNCEEYYNKTYK
jgi:hypothetical protein